MAENVDPSSLKELDDEIPKSNFSKKRLIITTIIGLVVVVGVFTLILPEIGSYGQAFERLKTLDTIWIAALITACALNILAYPYTVLVSVPGLKYWHGFIERQVGFLISCAIPGGGVFAIGAQYRILFRYGVAPARAASAVSADAVWVYLLTLSMPAIGLGLMTLEGENTGPYGWIAIAGLIAVTVSIILITIVLRSEAGAIKVGELANKMVRPIARRFKKPEPDFVPSLKTFRLQLHDLVKTRWKHITIANLIAQLTPFVVLVVALAGLGAFPENLTIIEIFAAYSVALLLVSIPISPGGLGTVDLALVALLTAFGASGPDAVAADLLWRLVWFLPQILSGLISGGIYLIGARKLNKDALEEPA